MCGLDFVSHDIDPMGHFSKLNIYRQYGCVGMCYFHLNSHFCIFFVLLCKDLFFLFIHKRRSNKGCNTHFSGGIILSNEISNAELNFFF